MTNVVSIFTGAPVLQPETTPQPMASTLDRRLGELASVYPLVVDGVPDAIILYKMVEAGWAKSTAKRRLAALHKVIETGDWSPLSPKGRECHGPQPWHPVALELDQSMPYTHFSNGRIAEALRKRGFDVNTDQVRYFFRRQGYR